MKTTRRGLVAIIAFTVSGCSDDAVTRFNRAIETGADCPQLYELRNQAQRGASTAVQEAMNSRLRSLQCFSSTSTRAVPSPAKGGAFTVAEYRIYRDVIDSPQSLSLEQALEAVARKHGVTPTTAGDTAKRVQVDLFENKWFATPEAEIRHASDWNGEAQ